MNKMEFNKVPKSKLQLRNKFKLCTEKCKDLKRNHIYNEWTKIKIKMEVTFGTGKLNTNLKFNEVTITIIFFK